MHLLLLDTETFWNFKNTRQTKKEKYQIKNFPISFNFTEITIFNCGFIECCGDNTKIWLEASAL